MKYTRTFLFFNFVVVYFIYVASAGILFEKKTTVSIIVGVGFFLYSLYNSLRYNGFNRTTKVILLYLLFLFVLISFSSNYLYSLKNLLKSATPMLYFILAVTFTRSFKDLSRINLSIIILIGLFILNIVISNLFDLGGVQYEDETTIDVGNVYTAGLNSMAYSLVLFPVLWSSIPEDSKILRYVVGAFAFIAFVIMLILLKRGALLGLGIGYSVWFFLSRFKYKRRITWIMVVVSIGLIITYPLYQELLSERVSARQERLTLSSYQTEGRYLENELVFKDIILGGDPLLFLFGHEMFNSSGNYGGGIWGARQIHNDYGMLLNGSGVVGLLFYLYMNYYILKLFLYERRRVRFFNRFQSREKMLNVLFFAFFIMHFFMGLSGTIDGTLYTGIRYIYLGAIIGVFRNINLHEKSLRINSFRNLNEPDLKSIQIPQVIA